MIWVESSWKGHETDNYSHLDAWKLPNYCFCYYRLFLSTFLIPLLTEGWKCDFFVRHNVSKHFSTFCRPNTVLTPLKSDSKAPSERFVRPLCTPNKDFGKRNKRWNPDFRSTFQWLVAQNRVLTPLKKCFETPDFIFCSSFQNLRLGGLTFQNLRLGGVKFSSTFTSPLTHGWHARSFNTAGMHAPLTRLACTLL